MKPLIFLLIVWIWIFSSSNAYFDYNCENEKIFFLEKISGTKAIVSSLYCDFWREIEMTVSPQTKVKQWIFVSYDVEHNILSPMENQDIKQYVIRLKTDLSIIKKDDVIKKKMFDEFTINFRDHTNIFSQFYTQYIFTKKEQLELKAMTAKQPYKIFENTAWKRLLMNGEIISREEWGANESLTTKEVYMKWCEDGSCFVGWPTAPNQLKENYMQNFNTQDAKDALVKYYNNWNDSRRYYPVDRIILHHTAVSYKATKNEWINYMRSLLSYHAVTLRWGDIWYHYLIDGEGNIYEWRAWGKYVLGAHVSTHNYGTIGISLMSDWYYSDAMLESLKKLVVYLGEEYDLDLTQETKVRSRDLTGWTTDWAVLAHKELDPRKPVDPEIIMDIFRQQVAKVVQERAQLSQIKK